MKRVPPSLLNVNKIFARLVSLVSPSYKSVSIVDLAGLFINILQTSLSKIKEGHNNINKMVYICLEVYLPINLAQSYFIFVP